MFNPLTRETFDDAIDWLEKYHWPTELNKPRRHLSSEAKELYWKELKHLDESVFISAIEEHCRKSRPGDFPTIEKILSFIATHREQSWQRVKGCENKKPLSNPRGNEKIKTMMNFLWQRLSGQMTQAELEARVKELGN